MRPLSGKINVIPPGGSYPFGRVRDNDGSSNGTPVDEDLLGDLIQLAEKLMSAAGLSPNNLPENNTDGFQLYNAIEALINLAVAAEATLRASGDSTEASARIAADSALAAKNPSGLITTFVNIGNWNLVSTPGVNIPHGLTFAKIIGVRVYILDDSSTTLSQVGSGTAAEGTYYVQGANISIVGGTSFQNVNYDNPSFNRGYIIIESLP